MGQNGNRNFYYTWILYTNALNKIRQKKCRGSVWVRAFLTLDAYLFSLLIFDMRFVK